MGRGQVVLVLVLLVGGCAAQVTPGSLTAPATAVYRADDDGREHYATWPLGGL
jgi:hypothetical protein